MKCRRLIIGLMMAAAVTAPAAAQISDIVNGLTNVVIPAIVQGSGYKGYLEADFTKGVGNYRCSFVTLATSQGYQFSDYFYMGAGIGVDFMWSTINSGWGSGPVSYAPDWYSHETTTHAVMIPVFSDFRFMFGNNTSLGFFINVRLGAAFLCSDDYVRIRDGYLTSNSYFYFQPAVGMRIPINRTKPRRALDVGVHYRMMTSNYWSGWQHNAVINGIGLNVTYEW